MPYSICILLFSRNFVAPSIHDPKARQAFDLQAAVRISIARIHRYAAETTVTDFSVIIPTYNRMDVLPAEYRRSVGYQYPWHEVSTLRDAPAVSE